MKSKEEEFCKDSFDAYLREKIPIRSLLWKEVEKVAEPPDFYLCVGNTEYAVEVTTLIEKIDVGTNNQLPVKVIIRHLKKFVKDEVEVIAKNNNYLRGTYLITFSKPITNFTKIKDMIQTGLRSYISDTQVVNKAAPRVVYKNGRQECQIEKVHNQQDKVIMGGIIISKWEEEALATARQLFYVRLDEKMHKLRNLSHPKILLLYDRFPFTSVEAYNTCISEGSFTDFFHTIFITGSDGESKILYSKETDWR